MLVPNAHKYDTSHAVLPGEELITWFTIWMKWKSYESLLLTSILSAIIQKVLGKVVFSKCFTCYYNCGQAAFLQFFNWLCEVRAIGSGFLCQFSIYFTQLVHWTRIDNTKYLEHSHCHVTLYLWKIWAFLSIFDRFLSIVLTSEDDLLNK